MQLKLKLHKATSLSKSIQGKATNVVVYLTNKSQSSTLKFKIVMEVQSVKLTNYKYLRVFDTLTFAHVKKDKLETWVEWCILIEYAKKWMV